VTQFQDRPFTLLGVHTGGYDSAALRPVVAKEKLTWRSFADPEQQGQGRITARWNVSATPTLYVIDHRGVIRRKWLGNPGDAAIDLALRELIEEAERDSEQGRP
jgi:hypothetical protein